MKIAFAILLGAIIYLTSSCLSAGPYPISPGKVKIFLEGSWARSYGFFDRNGKLIKLAPRECLENIKIEGIGCKQTYNKKEGKVYIEIGALPLVTLLTEVEGGQEESFQNRERRNWLTISGGIRFNLYRGLIVISLENNHGYRFEKIKWIQQLEQEGYFLQLALLLGRSWYPNRFWNIHLSSDHRWEKNWNRAEADNLTNDLAFNLQLLPAFLGFELMLLNELFTRLTLEELRSTKMVYQPSLVIFPKKEFGIQLGYRTSIIGESIEASHTVFAKIWLIF